MRPLDARSRRVAQLKFLCRLLPPSLLQRLVMLTRLQPNDPRLLLRLRTLSAERTGSAILPGETRLEDHPVLRIGVRQPGAAVKSRLERGRGMLRHRLGQRGIELPAAFLVLSLT